MINSDTGKENEVLEVWVDNGNYTPSEYYSPSFTVKGIDFDDICLTATVVVLDEDDTPCRYCYDRYGIFNRDILPL